MFARHSHSPSRAFFVYVVAHYGCLHRVILRVVYWTYMVNKGLSIRRVGLSSLFTNTDAVLSYRESNQIDNRLGVIKGYSYFELDSISWPQHMAQTLHSPLRHHVSVKGQGLYGE